MLSARLLSSAILIPLLALLVWADQQLGVSAALFLLMCLGIACRNTWEMHQLLSGRIATPTAVLTTLLSSFVVISVWIPALLADIPLSPATQLAALGAALTFSFIAAITFAAFRFREPGGALEQIGCTLIIVGYCGGLTAATAILRWQPSNDTGFFALLSLIVCVKAGDTTAYTFGRLWGSRKMAPHLSPGKTWMGLLGAVVGSCLGAWLWICFPLPGYASQIQPTSQLTVLGYGLTVGLAGLMGDLCESLIKRDCKQKDSASLMPGFGGLLDIVDSPVFAGPIALAWWLLLPPAV